ncbi:hypothetical protein [Acinetobacter sp. YH12085]|uniref:hypothetical protein n=1 Tax=Acinetobacter sp. YH12085 TaxID=2601077 RepID=UPI0015D232B2|nr:hypothetical protein [Acinetobacter sp. YH12085]
MKFLKIGNTILNVSRIECVTENKVIVGYSGADDLPFGDEIREVKGISVFMINPADQGGCFVFENETIESFYEKLVAA